MPAYAPTLDRTTLVEGPAHLIFDKTGLQAAWKYCWCAGNVSFHLVHRAKPLPVAGFGDADDPRMDEVVEIDFTPAGNFSEALFDWLFAGVFALKPGQTIFGAADTPVSLHTLDGQLWTVTNARVTQFPAIRFGAGGPRFEGAAKITGVIGKGLARTASNALFTAPASVAFSAVPAAADFLHLPCNAVWDLATDIAIMTDAAGWTLRAGHTISPRYNPDVGTYDFRVDQVLVEASCRPANVSDATLISAALIGSSRALGASSTAGTLTLAEDNPGLTAALYGARLVTKPQVYSENEPRAGELTWRAYHTASGLCSVDITPAA
jgi:hypothetical protein